MSSAFSRQNLILFLVSVASLFIELVLIRWVSTEVRIFAYLQNFVLLACFLGIGLGCAYSRKPCHLWISAATLGVLIFCISLPLNVTIDRAPTHIFKGIPIFLAAFHDTVIHYQLTTGHLRIMQALGIVLTIFIFILNILILFPLGQLMGKIFDEHPKTIYAYSINVAASLLGVWVFSALSFVYTSPWLWFLLALIMIVWLMALTNKWREAASLISIGFLLSGIIYLYVSAHNWKANGMAVWSPYQKLTLRPIVPYPKGIDPFQTRSDVGYELDVNGVSFMFLSNLSDSFRRGYTEYFEQHPMYRWEIPGPTNSWNLPFSIKKDAKSVLILGAGAGDDAAAAVRNGLEEIDIVEIDPGIIKLGQKYHPEQPYSKENVHVFVDDARAYFNRSHKKYDVIHLGLLDSHSQASSMTNIRMDHYVYTLESFNEAKRLLKPDGVFIISFYVQRIWLGQRVEDLLTKAFGWQPLVFGVGGTSGKGKVVMVSGHDREYVLQLISSNPAIFPYIEKNTIGYQNVFPGLKMTTDDWPYMYLQHPQIPTMHMIMIGILLVLLLIARGLLLNKNERIQWHFFFLGAGFLLLEFQNINKTSLLFGSTWLVSAINISAILFLILLANLVAAKWKNIGIKLPYICLFVTLLTIYFIPLQSYNHLPFFMRAIVTGLILNLPIFFSGIVFISSFKAFDKKHLAFGSNLMGAAVGGILEYLSYLLGIQALVLVALILYVLSLVFIKK